MWLCEKCAAKIPQQEIELDGDYKIVCRQCYLANPPQEDIDAAMHDVAIEAASPLIEESLGPVQVLTLTEALHSRRQEAR